MKYRVLSQKLERALSMSEYLPPKDLPLLKQEPPSVIQIIEEVLDIRKTVKPGFHPSGMFGCTRSNVFDYNFGGVYREPKNNDNRMQRILDNGTGVHQRILGPKDQGYLSQHPDYWFAPEAKIYRRVAGVWVKGSSDGILFRREDLYRWGVEAKSKYHDAFIKLTVPEEKHILQASTYAVLSGLWWITILYEDKDKQHMREYPVEFEPKLWKEVKGRLRELKEFVDANAIPKFNADECDPTFCSFVNHCKKLGGKPDKVRPRPVWAK